MYELGAKRAGPFTRPETCLFIDNVCLLYCFYNWVIQGSLAGPRAPSVFQGMSGVARVRPRGDLQGRPTDLFGPG